MTTLILVFLFTAFELFIFYSFFLTVAALKGKFLIRPYKISYLLFTHLLLFGGISVIINLDQSPMYNTAYTFALVLIFISYMFDLKIQQRVFYSGLIIFVGQGADVLIGSLFTYIPAAERIIDTPFLIYMIATQVMFFMLSKLAAYALGKNKATLPNTYWLTFIVIMLVSILELHYVATLVGLLGSTEQVLLVVIAICMFLINLMILIVFELLVADQNKILEASEELLAHKFSEEKMQLILEYAGKSAERSHNLEHNILNIAEFIDYNKLDECVKYINALGIELKKDRTLRSKLHFPFNKSADTLLNIKIEKAINAGIQVETDIRIFKKIPIDDDIDLCLVISNILDNAIIASEKNNKSQIFIKAFDNEKGTFFQFENYSDKVLFNESGLIETSKKDKISHGHGLKIVQKIVEKYNGLMDLKYKEEIFTVSLVFLN